MKQKSEYHMSATSITSFKGCPTQFRLAYREGLRKIEDTDSQRMGTNWGALHETFAEAKAVLDGDDVADAEDVGIAAVVALLNERYSQRPASKTDEEWAVEQQQLLNGFIGYLWYWQNDRYQVLASEVPFKLPLTTPSGRKLPLNRVARVGKMDHIILWHESVCVLERKSTSRSIEPDSDYWDKGKKDTQVSMYSLAFRDMHASGELAHLGPLPLKEGESMPARYGTTLYDVWHKPTIKPKMLTQADTAAFIETGDYCGQKFTVETLTTDQGVIYTVNGSAAVIEPGKRGSALRETPEMYGARLLQDIQQRPEFYYARRELVRTDRELQQFERALYGIYKAQRAYEREDCWFENENQCRATYSCPFIPICYGPGSSAVCDGSTTPDGFKRIFVDLTIKGQAVAPED